MDRSERVATDEITSLKEKRLLDRRFKRIVWAILIVGAVVVLYPIFHMLMMSFSGSVDVIKRKGFLLFPSAPTLENYKHLFSVKQNIRQAILVTATRTLIGTVTSTTANAMLAYILSRRKFMFRSGLTRFWIYTLVAPVGLLPQLVLFYRLHLMRSFWVYIIPGMVSVFHMMVMRTFMKTIPDSLEESAQLDGAGYVRIFLSIVSPLCKPVYAAIAFFIAVSHWNSWFDTLIYNRMEPKYTTLQYELLKYISSASSTSVSTNSQVTVSNVVTRTSLVAALSVLSMLPVIILYPFFQKYFVAGLTIRGIKE